ncbi:hypothetical protein LZ31DRAFT_601946 [Colletotrichum somersetense]|nr:hypothetical protein LZ31DRAFT_601946 [Colletotrichum somersetense]
MRNFPTEILLLIFDNLRSSDLSRTARCCRLYHALATPKLYESLRIRMKSRLTDQQVPKLLSTLMQPSYMHQFIRRVDVVVDDDCLWTRDHSWLLSIMLKHILNHSDASKRVRSYRWTASYPFTGLVFPNLQQLDCGAVGPQSIEPRLS